LTAQFRSLHSTSCTGEVGLSNSERLYMTQTASRDRDPVDCKIDTAYLRVHRYNLYDRTWFYRHHRLDLLAPSTDSESRPFLFFPLCFSFSSLSNSNRCMRSMEPFNTLFSPNRTTTARRLFRVRVSLTSNASSTYTTTSVLSMKSSKLKKNHPPEYS
jgi:hypothetical protein